MTPAMTLLQTVSASLPGLTRQSIDNSQILEMDALVDAAHDEVAP
ncbi:MAG TPA: hypothetical protein VJ890_15145 [Vineibacter sp.]|nr:hypothetical protein [Vineibacter sp.]